MKYRWGNAINGFDMPVRVFIEGKPLWLAPTSQWTTINLAEQHSRVGNPKVKVDANFYISTLNILGS